MSWVGARNAGPNPPTACSISPELLQALHRKMENTPLKKALLNERPAAVRGLMLCKSAVQQVCERVFAYVCMCVCVYVCARTVREIKWTEIAMSLSLKWERRSKVAKTPVTRLHESHPY